MAFILGKKIAMTQIFKEDGTAVPATLVHAGPVTVLQIRTEENDGYKAVQFGMGAKRRIPKPLERHIAKSGAGIKPAYVREFRAEDDKETESLKVGDVLNASIFSVGDIVKVSGISKAKGFQGVVKRHGFAGAPASHGHKSVLRHAGSTGQRFPQHTLKGLRMAGRMGGARSTVRGLEVLDVDDKNNTILLKGAIPGHKGTLLEIQKLDKK